MLVAGSPHTSHPSSIPSLLFLSSQFHWWSLLKLRLSLTLLRQYVGSILSARATRIFEALLPAVLLQRVQIDNHFNQMHAQGRLFLPGFLQYLMPLLPCRLYNTCLLCYG